MNIVMVDSQQLVGDADFPDINLDKYGWLQFTELDEQELEERCWRADVVISANTAIKASLINEAFKLKLIIAAGDKFEHIDLDAAKARGITVCHTPGLTGDKPESTQAVCEQVGKIINAWLKQAPINTI